MRAIIFGFLPFLLVTAFGRWYYVCKVHQLCGDATEIKKDDPRPATLDLTDEDSGKVIFKDFDEFSFSEKNGLPDLNENNETFIDSLAAYLNRQPSKNLSITGNYLESEKKTKYGYYENLGQARANEIRELLLEKGIEENRFAVDYDIVAGDSLMNPIIFEVFDNNGNNNSNVDSENTGNGSERLVKEAFSFTNMSYSDANFAYNSDVFQPGDAFKLYADSVRTYLSENPNKILTVVGHTDNIGGDEFNDDLGKRRAESAKAYFNGLGVSNTINTVSMGKRQPLATNETDEGRQKNRRVNFKLE